MNSIPAPRYDESFETVGAQVIEQLDHRLIDKLMVRPLEARMLRSGEPVLDNRLEFFRGIASVRNHHEFQQALLSRGCERFHIVVEHRLERLALFPLRVFRGKRLDPIEGEKPLEIKRLLRPERPVVVEHGDAFGGRDKVRRAFLRHLCDEFDDGLLGLGVVPRWQYVGDHFSFACGFHGRILFVSDRSDHCTFSTLGGIQVPSRIAFSAQ
jgi:hypothetical protein